MTSVRAVRLPFNSILLPLDYKLRSHNNLTASYPTHIVAVAAALLAYLTTLKHVTPGSPKGIQTTFAACWCEISHRPTFSIPNCCLNFMQYSLLSLISHHTVPAHSTSDVVLRQDRSETKKFGLGLAGLGCSFVKHNLVTLVIIMILKYTATFQVLFIVSLCCAWNITTVEINSGVQLLTS